MCQAKPGNRCQSSAYTRVDTAVNWGHMTPGDQSSQYRTVCDSTMEAIGVTKDSDFQEILREPGIDQKLVRHIRASEEKIRDARARLSKELKEQEAEGRISKEDRLVQSKIMDQKVADRRERAMAEIRSSFPDDSDEEFRARFKSVTDQIILRHKRSKDDPKATDKHIEQNFYDEALATKNQLPPANALAHAYTEKMGDEVLAREGLSYVNRLNDEEHATLSRRSGVPLDTLRTIKAGMRTAEFEIENRPLTSDYNKKGKIYEAERITEDPEEARELIRTGERRKWERGVSPVYWEAIASDAATWQKPDTDANHYAPLRTERTQRNMEAMGIRAVERQKVKLGTEKEYFVSQYQGRGDLGHALMGFGDTNTLVTTSTSVDAPNGPTMVTIKQDGEGPAWKKQFESATQANVWMHACLDHKVRTNESEQQSNQQSKPGPTGFLEGFKMFKRKKAA